MKSSIDRLNARSPAATTPGRISGNVTFQNVTHLVRPEVHRRLLKPAVEPDSRAHRDHDVADVEHDVGDEDRLDAEWEEQAGHDDRIGRDEQGEQARRPSRSPAWPSAGR